MLCLIGTPINAPNREFKKTPNPALSIINYPFEMRMIVVMPSWWMLAIDKLFDTRAHAFTPCQLTRVHMRSHHARYAISCMYLARVEEKLKNNTEALKLFEKVCVPLGLNLNLQNMSDNQAPAWPLRQSIRTK